MGFAQLCIQLSIFITSVICILLFGEDFLGIFALLSLFVGPICKSVPFPMISGVIIGKSREKLQLESTLKTTFTFTFPFVGHYYTEMVDMVGDLCRKLLMAQSE